MRNLLCVMLVLMLGVPAVAQSGKDKKPVGQETANGYKLKLYPETADKYVNIYVECAAVTDFTITVTGDAATGGQLKEWKVDAKTSWQTSMDVTQLPEGGYTVTFRGGGMVITKNFNVKR